MKTRSSEDEWRVLCVEGMWFQDLWTYDFRRTEMCVIPYGTEEGEIPFCAYNTGIGWRQIVESMHKTATLAEWHQIKGRHEIFAQGREVELKAKQHGLVLPAIDTFPAACGSCRNSNPATTDGSKEILVESKSGR
jgi:hypothetical protein